MGDLESRRPSSGGGLFTFGHAERFICGSEQSLAAALVCRGICRSTESEFRDRRHITNGQIQGIKTVAQAFPVP
jgi:hypothetical protein